MSRLAPRIAIVMGSSSDLPRMREASDALDFFELAHDVHIVSAHRTPDWMSQFARSAASRGYRLIIAGAGGAAHLPGMVASHTALPVIGVPLDVGHLNGLDALLSVAQMPKGVPVACVAVGNAYNAGLLAVRILSLEDTLLAQRLERFMSKQTRSVLGDNARLRKSRRTSGRKPAKRSRRS